MAITGVQVNEFNATFEQEEDAGLLVFVCRGESGCGQVMFAEDRERHADFHLKQEKRAAELQAQIDGVSAG